MVTDPADQTGTLTPLVTSSTSTQVISNRDIISDLEGRYIRLLESKIANLESQLEFGRPEPDIPDDVCPSFSLFDFDYVTGDILVNVTGI